MIHERTPRTEDGRSWLEARYPEGDVVIDHTAECDRASAGDECQGGCPVIDYPGDDISHHGSAEPLDDDETGATR